MKYLLGIDFGGGSSKATLLAENGEVIATNSFEYETLCPKPGWTEQNPEDWYTAIKENMHETYIYIGKRRVMVDEFSIGGKEFINLVKKKYRTLHNGQSLPKITKSKNDIFNGHVKDVTGFYVAYGLVSIILVGFIIFMVCDICIPKNG